MTTSIHENSAPDGGGIGNQGARVSILKSTISGNDASQNGGGIYSDSIWVMNSTISGNTAAAMGGGIYGGGSLTSSTLTANSAGAEGGGIYSINNIYYTMQNSILAGNTAAASGSDCKATIDDWGKGYNLIGDMEGCSISSFYAGDLVHVNPGLGPLLDNGGQTLTHALLPGSAAINSGNPVGCSDLAGSPIINDQRGFPRAGRCDIGAYELQPEAAEDNALFLPVVARVCPTQLYFDDFSDPTSGWPAEDNPVALTEYLNGEYRILVKTAGYISGAKSGFNATDYIVSADVHPANDVDGAYGILFGLSEDWSRFYTLEVNRYRGYSVNLFLQEEDTYNRYLWTAGNYATTQHDLGTHKLKIKKSGSLMWVSIDGFLMNILPYEDDPVPRYVGLVVLSYGQPDIDARFDNFTVEPISCEGLVTAIQNARIESRRYNLMNPLTGIYRPGDDHLIDIGK